MATIKQLNYETIVSVMTTELNSLANNAYAISSAMGADGTASHLYGDFILGFTLAATPTADTLLDLFLIRSADGTNYQDGSTSIVPSPTSYVGSFRTRAVSTAQIDIIPDVRLPPGLYKAILFNNGTGKAMAASGNTLKMRPHNLQSV